MRTTSGKDWIWEPTRQAVYARDGFRCIACPSRENLSLDHVDPEGPNRPSNLVTLCKPCNASKGRRSIAEWRPELVDEVLAALASPIDRALGRELTREVRPSRLASHDHRTSNAERRRRRERRALLEDIAIASFEAFALEESELGDFRSRRTA